MHWLRCALLQMRGINIVVQKDTHFPMNADRQFLVKLLASEARHTLLPAFATSELYMGGTCYPKTALLPLDRSL
jgi:hypothetical protein